MYRKEKYKTNSYLAPKIMKFDICAPYDEDVAVKNIYCQFFLFCIQEVFFLYFSP
jgi:hypothetical protein